MKNNDKKKLSLDDDIAYLGYNNDSSLKEKLDSLEFINDRLAIRNASLNDVCTALTMLNILKFSDLENFKLILNPLVEYLRELLYQNTLDLNEMCNLHYDI